jgi:hypothetical protein
MTMFSLTPLGAFNYYEWLTRSRCKKGYGSKETDATVHQHTGTISQDNMLMQAYLIVKVVGLVEETYTNAKRICVKQYGDVRVVNDSNFKVWWLSMQKNEWLWRSKRIQCLRGKHGRNKNLWTPALCEYRHFCGIKYRMECPFRAISLHLTRGRI